MLPSAQAVLLPEHIGYAEGACFGIPALTALQAVHLAELSPASTVMIVGGAGSVAHYAIQFAKMRGARVITTVSGPEKAAHARSAGADEVINYRTENVGQRVKPARYVRPYSRGQKNDFRVIMAALPPEAVISLHRTK